MATPQSIRYLNEVQALNALFRLGGMSRADLARRLNLNRASVGYIIQDLLTAGLVRERSGPDGGGAPVRAGRPGIVVELDPGGATFVGAEIGVDHITAVAIDLSARAFLHRSVPYATAARPPQVGIRRAAGLIQSVARSLEKGRGVIQGACVAVPALVRDGTVVNALMLGWREVPLRDLLQEALGRRVTVLVENDANALAIGETYGVASQPWDTVVCLDIENGAGGGIVIGGELFRGSTGFAGELGQLPLGGAGFASGLQRSGHLESYIGKDAVLARYRNNGGPASADLLQLLAALRARERIALRTAAEWGDRLAHGLTLVVHVVNPGRIVVGGSVAAIYPHVAERVREAMRKEFLEGFPLPDIEASRLGTAGTAYGAACLLHQRMFSVDERLVHPQEVREGRRRGAKPRRVRHWSGGKPGSPGAQPAGGAARRG